MGSAATIAETGRPARHISPDPFSVSAQCMLMRAYHHHLSLVSPGGGAVRQCRPARESRGRAYAIQAQSQVRVQAGQCHGPCLAPSATGQASR